jgi:proteasome assembly chaperone (PAC2) family protein
MSDLPQPADGSAHHELTWYSEPELVQPLLVIAFEGLFDAAEAASGALEWIRGRTTPEPLAMIDPERFYNFQEARPMVRLDQHGSRVIDWPTIEVEAVRNEGARDVLLMVGTEPQYRWQAFSRHVLDVATRAGCEMVVTLGAFVGMVPHSRPFTVTGSVADADLAARLQLSTPTYQGPTGLIGVINAGLEQAQIPVVSLRVEVPHYVPGAPNPKATQALLRRLEHTTGISTGFEELDASVQDWVERVDQAVASDDESREYVARLERQVDSSESSLPTGDDLAAELEAFLRDRPVPDVGDQDRGHVESGPVGPGSGEPDEEVEPDDEAGSAGHGQGDEPE